jgi:hypothetical protein
MDTFSTDEALKLSFAIYRINKNYYKETVYDKDGNVSFWGNKDAIKFMFALKAISEGSKNHWVPEQFEPVEVTNEDVAALESARSHFKRYTFLMIGNDLSQFQRDTFAAFSSEECTPKNVGFVAYVPAMIQRELHDLAYRRRLKTDFVDSVHYNVDSSISGELEILRSFYLKDYNLYSYIAGVGGNLVHFNKDKKYEIGSKYSIRAKAKKHEIEYDTRLPMTKLNYVKLSYIEEK